MKLVLLKNKLKNYNGKPNVFPELLQELSQWIHPSVFTAKNTPNNMVTFYNTKEQWENAMKPIKDRLLWIDENIGPDHIDYVKYLDEISQLEDDLGRIKNLEPSTIPPYPFQDMSYEQSALFNTMNNVQYQFSYNEHNPRRDPIELQAHDLIRLCKLHGMHELSNVIDQNLDRIISHSKYEQEQNFMRMRGDYSSDIYGS